MNEEIDDDSAANGKHMYHEKQHKQYCAIHSINNLFQKPNVCTKEMMDQICYNLDPNSRINHHKSVMGFGNYDINVISAFLKTKNYQVIWFDKRKAVETINLKTIFGFLLNGSSTTKIFGVPMPFSSSFKHWYVVRMLECGHFFNLDSKLDKPSKIGDATELMKFLQKKIKEQNHQLLLVVEMGMSREDIMVES